MSQWYDRARQDARTLAKAHGITLRRAAGIIAALSPCQRYETCVKQSYALLNDTSAPVSCFPVHKAQAIRIVEGVPPMRALSGPKVRAFYRAILGDQQTIVIDRWIIRAFRRGKHGSEKPTKTERRDIERWIRRSARRWDITPAQAQARIWEKIRSKANGRTMRTSKLR